MKRGTLVYLIGFLLLLAGCEEVYHPDLEEGEALLVVDARVVAGAGGSQVRVYKTLGFNSWDQPFPAVTTAEVSLVDGHGGSLELEHTSGGNYRLTAPLSLFERYKLVVKAEGEVYESGFQEIPALPAIDSVYLVPGQKLVETGTDEAAGNLRTEEGAQLYIDISARNGENCYRFTSRKVCQYAWVIESTGPFPPITNYAWMSMKPWELFNIAGPAEYSSSEEIRRHPLVFLERSYSISMPDHPVYFLGWIYICHQYAISRESYLFYKELNSQLSAEGKLFDPLYTQVRGNLRCTSDPGKVVLGNFEIARVREHRFFVIYQGKEQYFMKRIPWFYEIPTEGSLADEIPVWWEVPVRNYPGSGG
ncbi:MAG: DUF4249 domain-containing protein [Prolixibacteraceae bacterium]|nr:DUF4249 domain-containing protein [Prolixibacteraceae bacterium]